MILDAAQPGDLTALHDLHRASWADAYVGQVPDAALGAPLDDHMAHTWTELPPGITVAREGGRLLGFVRLKTRQGWPYVDNLHIDPARRGGGIGAALLAAAADQAALRGRMWLTVLAANHAARRFYARHGGVEGARIAEFLLGTPVVTFPVIWGHLGAARRRAE